MSLLFYIEARLKGKNSGFAGAAQLIDRKAKLRVDGRFWKSIIRPTSGAVETENSLRFNELSRFRRGWASVYRSLEGAGRAVLFGSIGGSIISVESGEKEVLTAASNAVEFASR
ncbi:hypothetical protein [Pseudomonas thivervalensis]|uniref:hypothetical protein n=1 Tax=Pseudomonas thivervalensis TaxID=86265 RepID=UPI0012E1D971|nr:hypothetical protein [Pseudomonas thivervalensis]